ncbi:MAG TPA: Rnf-Nqr domain containing protein [Candidatus Ozemobacteraceae bacterium]|nr:Rnf-Nqr domain containing protein [Candidatus Ozemobacteraceae bacterium]
MESQLTTPLLTILFTAAIAENMGLYFFLGTCPLISISSDLRASLQMGVTVSLVMLLTVAANFAIFHGILAPLGLEYLQLLFFILTIAAVTQLLEEFLDRFFQAVHASFGIFLPLIAVNCAILGVSMFAVLREYDLFSSLAFAAGSGLGWSLVLCLIASMRRRIELAAVSPHLGRTGVTMLIAAVMAMAFTGLAGLFNGGSL